MRKANLAAIYHMPWLEYRHALPDGRVCLRVRTAENDFTAVSVRYCCTYRGENAFANAKELPMPLIYRDDRYDYFETVFRPDDPRVRYLFVLKTEDWTVKLDAEGCHPGADAPERGEDAFVLAYAYPPAPKPEWARGSVGYQIFPDRFRRAGPPDASLERWESPRTASELRFGGNLNGIRDAVPYLHDLGVDIVYTTPLFASDTAHHYNTFDYYAIDPLFGTEQDLKALCDELHRHGMRLVLDGVFNHSGVGFAPFQDALAKGAESAYYDWFFFDDSRECGYQTFSFEPYMPKLNLRNAACAKYFLDVGRYWLESCGIDGWRLDVSPEVWPDFWRAYRRMMKEVNENSLMVAECWDDSREWVTNGDMFDSTMNYVFSRAVWRRIAQQIDSVQAFDHSINRCQMLYPHAVQEVLWNFLGSHDTERLLTRAGGNAALQRAASFFQLTCPGVPFLYYGDELGMEGGPDPDCRRPMRWDATESNDTFAHYQRLIRLRKENPALRLGAFRTHRTEENGLYAYLRIADSQKALMVLNTSAQAVQTILPLPDGLSARPSLTDAYSQKTFYPRDDQLWVDLAAGQGLIFLYE